MFVVYTFVFVLIKMKKNVFEIEIDIKRHQMIPVSRFMVFASLPVCACIIYFRAKDMPDLRRLSQMKTIRELNAGMIARNLLASQTTYYGKHSISYRGILEDEHLSKMRSKVARFSKRLFQVDSSHQSLW